MSDATMKDWLLPMQLRRTYGACEHSITGKMTNGILYSVCNSLSIVFKFLLISLDVFLQGHGIFDRRSLKECKLDDLAFQQNKIQVKCKQAYKSTKCARLSPILPSFLLSFLSLASLTHSVLIFNHEISNSRYIVPAIFHYRLCAKQLVHSRFSISISRRHDRWAMRC